MNVNLVNVMTQDRVRLDGIWWKPAAENESQHGVDVVLLMHGVGGNFNGAGMFEERGNSGEGMAGEQPRPRPPMRVEPMRCQGHAHWLLLAHSHLG